MELFFEKYHGTMNDFIVVDNRSKQLSAEHFAKITAMCERRKGIGADGVLVLETAEGFDYRMRIFNPDGNEISFCGNGARCLYRFALDKGIVKGPAIFIAGDGEHKVHSDGENIKLRMIPVRELEVHSSMPEIGKNRGVYFTGVEHLVLRVDDAEKENLEEIAAKYRPDGAVLPGGVNVNIFSVTENGIRVRTFERGVEAETFACGTGNVAVAYHLIKYNIISGSKVELRANGGKLTVEFPDGPGESPWLSGNAVRVYRGTIEI